MEEHKDSEIGALEAIAESAPRNPERRQFLISTLFGTTLPSLIMPSESYAQRKRAARPAQRRARPASRHQPVDYSKIPVPNVGYKEIFPDPELLGVRLAPSTSYSGRIQRAMRWENIAQAIERRYGVPHRIPLGMICVESEGDPTRPNDLGDGGAGLIHMQPSMTSGYGLKMITDSKKLRDFFQGRKIRGALDATDRDLKDLIAYDDRFHPIKNMDAAARMLCDLYETRGHSWWLALERYAGRRTYDSKIMSYANDIGRRNFMVQVENDFNRRNRNFIYRGSPMTFQRYLAIFRNQNRNYGIDDYSALVAKDGGKYRVHARTR